MPFLIAWRNVLKNKRRTIVTLILSMVATIFLIFYTSIFNGMFDKALKDAIEVYQGYMQVKGKGYSDKPTFENLLRDSKSIEAEIAQMTDIKDFTTRFETFVLLASEKLSIGAFFVGVNPEKEKSHSKFASSMIKGRWLNNQDTNSVVLGSGLAKKLKLKVGDKVAYVSNAIDYSFTADNLKVVGIFDTGFVDMDKRFAIVNKPYMDENFLTQGVATSIVILPKNINNVSEIAARFNKVLDKVDVDTWESFVETVTDMIDIKKQSAYVMF
ncbi:MAG: ABC transporter permease, partial [Thiovulaceae bacterium]|nr:ABC transporter permease [Sulfurimonadaceae bacterium]